MNVALHMPDFTNSLVYPPYAKTEELVSFLYEKTKPYQDIINFTGNPPNTYLIERIMRDVADRFLMLTCDGLILHKAFSNFTSQLLYFDHWNLELNGNAVLDSSNGKFEKFLKNCIWLEKQNEYSGNIIYDVKIYPSTDVNECIRELSLYNTDNLFIRLDFQNTPDPDNAAYNSADAFSPEDRLEQLIHLWHFWGENPKINIDMFNRLYWNTLHKNQHFCPSPYNRLEVFIDADGSIKAVVQNKKSINNKCAGCPALDYCPMDALIPSEYCKSVKNFMEWVKLPHVSLPLKDKVKWEKTRFFAI